MKRKTKKHGVRYWKKKAWDEFSKYIRLRDAIDTTGTKETAKCCTCHVQYPIAGLGCIQAGHFVPGRSHSLLFREMGTHAQCYICNKVLKGNWIEYEKFMLKKYGIHITQEEKDAKYLSVKYTAVQLEEIRDKYKEMYEELLRELKGGERK